MEEVELCFPQLLNASCRRPEPPQSEDLLINILLFFTSVLTAALNLLVIISISHFRQLHSPTNLLLLSLAVSDFFVGLLVLPIEVLFTRTCWVLGDLVCALYFFLPVTLISASVGSMVLISIDRYVAICDPLHYPTRVTDKLVTVSICLCWICSVLYSVFMLYDHLKQPGRYNSCYGECVVNIAGDVDLVVAFIIPITVIVVLYMRVFVVAVSQARAMRSHVAAVKLQFSVTLTQKSELKAARTLGIAVVVFLICYSPYYCLSLTGGSILVGSSTEAFMSYLMYFNSCLNPVIYALFYPWFRKAVKHIVTLQILQPDSCEANVL
ncbi:trace amine-associated receptor 4-like isoform X2 [Dicentrarchus labrax]|uniref:trace amine-associated receptor 4-like isoform X2 n=1 Tax=Dicentrarchus labrax TaxID=13489 RepID=UPI0021F685F4|nr:trace amine-associated receptor 4-like isoform X2 [Dicentrarchus labrax]